MAPPTGHLDVGLVGAGPWASTVFAPMLATHPRTRLAGVWARRPEAARDLAGQHGSRAADSFDALLERCDAVAFAVPPAVQADLALAAARAGRALLLEKPLALDLDGAVALASAVEEAGVPTQLDLTWRYADGVRHFLDAVGRATPIGGRGHFIAGGFLDGPFATPWRTDGNLLLDLGPHVLDVLDAALGPIVGIRGHGDPRRWLGLLLEHESGVTSEVSLTAYAGVDPHRAGVEVYTRQGVIEVDAAEAVGPDALTRMLDEFVATVAGAEQPLDVHHGLRLQRVLAAAVEAVER